jgi:hypothetical protein
MEWVAGLAQGEGSFGFALQQVRKGTWRVTPFFQLAMKDEEAITKMASILQEHGLPVYRVTHRTGMYAIHVTGLKRLARYVEALSPYLVGFKLEAATAVGEYCASRMSKPKATPYSQAEVDCILRSRSANGGGRSKIDPRVLLSNPHIAAHQKAKTHCPQGHEYTEENTTHSNTGARRCRICDTAAKQRYVVRNREILRD